MLFALTRRTSVAAGEWVAVLGAGGGIGLATVDVAKALGARVVACASSDEKLAAARAAGADATVAYEAEGVDLKVAIRDATGGGADVLVDPVGGPKAEAALRALGWMGRYVVIGFAAGEILAYRRTRCCSTTAPSSASTGGPGPSAIPRAMPPSSPTCSPWSRAAPSIRSNRSPTRSSGRPTPRRPRVAAGHRQGRTGPVAPRLPAGGRQLGEAVEQEDLVGGLRREVEDDLRAAEGLVVVELAGVGTTAMGAISSVSGSRPPRRPPRAGGERLPQAASADRDPALGVLGDVSEELGPGGPAEQHREAALHGLRPRPARRKSTYSPWNSASSSSHSRRMASRCSRPRSRRRSYSTPWWFISSSFHPNPMPARPALETWSTEATALAVTMGSRWAARRMPVPSRRRSVTAAAAPRATSGSRLRLYFSSIGVRPVGSTGHGSCDWSGCACARGATASRARAPRGAQASSRMPIERSVGKTVIP